MFAISSVVDKFASIEGLIREDKLTPTQQKKKTKQNKAPPQKI